MSKNRKTVGINPKDAIGQTKPPLHLVPSSAAILEAMALRYGAEKYGPYNWRSGPPVRVTVYVSAMLRHLAAFMDGEDVAKDSGVHHLAHVRAGCGILLDAIANQHAQDDRPPTGCAADLLAKHTKKKAKK